MIDRFDIPGFLDAATLREVRAALHTAGGSEATVLSRQPEGRVEPGVRRTMRLTVPPETQARVTQLLTARKSDLEAHFGLPLAACEAPQFLRYRVGDFFVPHQDGNTPLVYDDSRFRRISVVVFLSTPSSEPEPDTYGGGTLVFHGPYTGPTLRVPVTPRAGTLVAFRAEMTHEVTPVTHGERYTIVSWFR